MLNVFVCDDNDRMRDQIKNHIESYIASRNYDMEVVLATGDPYEIIDYVRENKTTGLYFLDVELKCELNGIRLGEKIREYDPRGFIVFITAFPETLEMTFSYRVEAMDFIEKDIFSNVGKRVDECIAEAHKRYLGVTTSTRSKPIPLFIFENCGERFEVEQSQILCFERIRFSRNKIIIHTMNYKKEIEESLKEIGDYLTGDFFRCHESYIINFKQVDKIDFVNKNVIFKNGLTCPVSRREFNQLTKVLGRFQN